MSTLVIIPDDADVTTRALLEGLDWWMRQYARQYEADLREAIEKAVSQSDAVAEVAASYAVSPR